MSLSIFILSKTKSYEELKKDHKAAGIDPFNSFGFESWRTEVWGSQSIKKLGLKIIPSLESYNIYAYDETVKDLEKELSVIKENLPQLEKEFEFVEGWLGKRLENGIKTVNYIKDNSDLGIEIG